MYELSARYNIVECKSTASGKTFWRVYRIGVTDGISDHATESEARKAVKRYDAADRRRAA